MDEARVREIKKKQYQSLLEAAGSGYRKIARDGAAHGGRPPRGFAIVGGMHVPTSQNPVTASIVYPQSSLTARKHAFAASPGIALRGLQSADVMPRHSQAGGKEQDGVGTESVASIGSYPSAALLRSFANAHPQASDLSGFGLERSTIGEQVLGGDSHRPGTSTSSRNGMRGNKPTVRGSTAEVAHRAALGRGRGQAGPLQGTDTSYRSPTKSSGGSAATGFRRARTPQAARSFASPSSSTSGLGASLATKRYMGVASHRDSAGVDRSHSSQRKVEKGTEYDLPEWALPHGSDQMPISVRRELQRSMAKHAAGGAQGDGGRGDASSGRQHPGSLMDSSAVGLQLSRQGFGSVSSYASMTGGMGRGSLASLPGLGEEEMGPTGEQLVRSIRPAPLPPVIHLSREHLRQQLSSEESKVLMVQEWQESYAREAGAGFASPAIGLEAKLRRALVFSRAAEGRDGLGDSGAVVASNGAVGDPVELPTACAFEVLEELERHVGRYQPLMRLVRNVLARSVYEDGQEATDGDSRDQEEYVQQIWAELQEAKRIAATEATAAGVDQSAPAVLASTEYVRRLEQKLAGARAGVAGSTALLRYYRLRPWFTSAERLKSDKRRLARVIDGLKGALVQWEEARQTELEGVRRRSVVVDKWKSAFNKSRQVALKTQVLAMSNQKQTQGQQVEELKQRLATVDGCVDAFGGLGSDEDRVTFIKKSISEVSPHLLKQILAELLGDDAPVDMAVQQAASVVIHRQDAKHTDAVRLVSTVVKEHFRKTLLDGEEAQEPSAKYHDKATRQAADIIVNAADAAGKQAIGMALPRLLRQLPTWQRGAAIRFLVGSDARLLDQDELHALLEERDTTLVDEGVVRVMKPGDYALGLLKYMQGARTPAMLIGASAASLGAAGAGAGVHDEAGDDDEDDGQPASGAGGPSDGDRDSLDGFDSMELTDEQKEQVVKLDAVSDAEQGKLLRDLLDVMKGHAVESVVKASLEAHGPLRKPFRDDLGLEDRKALVELLMHKLPVQRAIKFLPLRIRTAIGQAKQEELEAAARAAKASGKKKFFEDPEAKYSPWRKYIKKAGVREAKGSTKRGPGKMKRLNLTGALSLAYDIIEHKIVEDKNDDERGDERQSLDAYIKDYLLQKYGLPSIVDQHIVNLVEAIQKYKGASSRVRTFGQALGVVKPGQFSYRLGAFVLALHRELFPRFKAVILRHKREGQCPIQLTDALNAAMFVFTHQKSVAFMDPERLRFPVDAQARLQSALVSMAMPVGQAYDDAGAKALREKGGTAEQIAATVVGKLELSEPKTSRAAGSYGGFRPAAITSTEADSGAARGSVAGSSTEGAASEASGATSAKLNPETPVVDFDHFIDVCVAIFEARQGWEKEVLTRMYDEYDDNGDGVLSVGEFSKIVKSLAQAAVKDAGRKSKRTGTTRAAEVLGLRKGGAGGASPRRALTDKTILQFFSEAHELSVEMSKEESGGFGGMPIARPSAGESDSEDEDDQGDVVLPMAFTRICDKYAIIPAGGLQSR